MSNKTTYKNIIIGTSIIAVTSILLYSYYNHTQTHPSTDNAYVNANLVNIAPKVNGYIEKIYVTNNQLVHKGDRLVDINPKDYALSVEQSHQNYIMVQQQAAETKTKIDSSMAEIKKAQSDYTFALNMSNRYTGLYKENAASKEDMQKYINQATQAKQNLEKAKSTLTQVTAQYASAISQVKIAKIDLEDKQNTNGYTRLTSPVDGYVSDLNLQPGELVSNGQKLFGLVDIKSWWVDVNFKETQLKYIKPGQDAEIELDMYDHKYKGKVQSISYASGNTFSLLPAQNATGNWVKVTQRYTVRITISDDSQFPLRVGSSAEATVDTTK